MKISIVHSHRLTREVLARTLSKRLNAETVGFSCLEDLLSSSMDYDVFLVYNMFGRDKMDRWDGVKWIKHQKPEALIVSVIHKRFFERKNSPPAADRITFVAEDDIEGLIKLVQNRQKAKLQSGGG
jgi:hypothetical protein